MVLHHYNQYSDIATLRLYSQHVNHTHYEVHLFLFPLALNVCPPRMQQYSGLIGLSTPLFLAPAIVSSKTQEKLHSYGVQVFFRKLQTMQIFPLLQTDKWISYFYFSRFYYSRILGRIQFFYLFYRHGKISCVHTFRKSMCATPSHSSCCDFRCRDSRNTATIKYYSKQVILRSDYVSP